MKLPRAIGSAIALSFLALGALRAEGLWYALAFPLALWLCWPEPGRGEPGLSADALRAGLRVTRLVGATFPRAGQDVAVSLRVQNDGARLDYVDLRDSIPEGASLVSGSIRWRGSLEAGASVELRYILSFRRGRHDFGPVEALAANPLSGMEARVELSCPDRVLVPPPVLRGPRLSAFPQAVRPYAGSSGAKRPGDGCEFHGTRVYVPGDRLRQLNWKAGALWGRELVNVYEGERAIDAGVILDCRAEAYYDELQFDAAASAALALSEAFLDGGNRVAFMQYGASLAWLPPGAGSAHRYRIRVAAGEAALGDHAVFERFDHLPIHVFPPKSLVVLVSPLLKDDAARLLEMAAQGYSLCVLRPREAASTGPASADLVLAQRILAREDRYLAARLRRAGISLLDWRPGMNLHELRDPARRGGSGGLA